MRRPKVTLPGEDPATKAAREREERRAEGLRTEETQSLLLGDTVRRLRRFGRIGSGGSVPIYGGSRSQGRSGRGSVGGIDGVDAALENSQFTGGAGRGTRNPNGLTLY